MYPGTSKDNGRLHCTSTILACNVVGCFTQPPIGRTGESAPVHGTPPRHRGVFLIEKDKICLYGIPNHCQTMIFFPSSFEVSCTVYFGSLDYSPCYRGTKL